MSFREKSAWISLVTVLVCAGVYFAGYLSEALPGFGLLYLFVGCIAALIILQHVLHAVASRTAAADEKAPLDERELLIQLRSHTVGYYTLAAGVIATFIPGHMGYDVFDMMNFALLALVLAVSAVSIAQIVMFRRGA